MHTDTYPDGTPLAPGDSLEDNPQGGYPPSLRDRFPGPWQIQRHGGRLHLVTAEGQTMAEILPTSGDWTGDHAAALLLAAETLLDPIDTTPYEIRVWADHADSREEEGLATVMRHLADQLEAAHAIIAKAERK